MYLFPFCHQALAVLTIYYIWNIHLRAWLRRERILRERVTYMLWVMANLAA